MRVPKNFDDPMVGDSFKGSLHRTYQESSIMTPIEELNRRALLHDQAAELLRQEANRHDQEARRLREEADKGGSDDVHT